MKHIYLLILAISITSCDALQNVQVPRELGSTTLTTEEIVRGLKEALRIGTGNAVNVLNRENGYLDDPKVHIPFPPELDHVADKMRQIGMDGLVNQFEESLNHAAEDAVTKAKPIFVNSIKDMTIGDARDILHGDNDAATEYFRDKTYRALYDAFKPDIQNSLERVKATRYWTQIAGAYNALPQTEDVETDLAAYTTRRALDGLFLKLEDEEEKIRENPEARVTEILRKVFGRVD